MAIESYSDLKSALSNWLARSDLDQFFEDIILLAEQRLTRDLRIREIEVTFSDTMSNGELDVPNDTGVNTFTELKHARLDIAGGNPLKMREADWIYEQYPLRSATSRPQYIAIDGSKFIFGPYPNSDYTVKGTYYKKPLLLSDTNTTNEWITAIPDALLMAALCETAPFLKDDGRIVVWEGKYSTIQKGYNVNYKRQARRESRVSYSRT